MRVPLILLSSLVTGAFLSWFALASLFTVFHPYDDEGYILISLRGYLDGASLYDHVYSQYGPFYHVAFGAIFRLLGLDPVNDTARFVTFVLWLGTSLMIAAA